MSMRSQISDLTLKATTTENKIQSLESEITAMKNNTKASGSTSVFDENIMHELQDRASREKNIIIVGLPECKMANADKSHSYDLDKVNSVINNLIPNCPKPNKIFRLGKYNPDKDRNLKVCFDSSYTTKTLFRNRDKLQSGIKIFSDLTPAQQKHKKELKTELEQRMANGEKDITIKYVRGIPKIVSTHDQKN